ncbi:unnamed protein product [Knipowitschia caucasica]|uniref:Uncharacterized protein n=1 Tax=Knipowitschia caucasica TaxID=637954 RepID=A0AAV2M9D8_KNICA
MTSTRKISKQQLTKERSDAERPDQDISDANISISTCPTAKDLNMAEILRETSFTETKASLDRLEGSMQEVNARLTTLESRAEEAECRINATADASQRSERVLRYLLRREATLTSHCDELQNRLRRNNMRIYQVKEESEKEDMIGFVKGLIKNVLHFPEDDVQIERTHRALGACYLVRLHHAP